jgi:hypothetical protein
MPRMKIASWNPVRIIQRLGRVDRISSQNACIQLVNYWPDISLDEYIRLKERVESWMMISGLDDFELISFLVVQEVA